MAIHFPTAFAVCSLAALTISGFAATANPLEPFLNNHCVSCHDATEKKGGLDLESMLQKPQSYSAAELLAKWERVHDRVRDGEMPPPKKTQPAPQVRNAFTQSLAASLTKSHSTLKGTVLRRLNRGEYERTLNALLGVRVDVAAMLPEDGKAFGFDNVGEALDLSPTQLHRYMEAAGIALDAAQNFGPKPEPKVLTGLFDTGRNAEFVGKNWHRREDGAIVFYTEGGYPEIKPDNFRTLAAGNYKIRIHAAAHQSEKPVAYGVFIGPNTFDKSAELFDVMEADPGAIKVAEFQTYLGKNFTIRFRPMLEKMLPYKQDPQSYTGPGLALLKVEFEGPLLQEWPPRGHKLRYGDLMAEDTGNPRDRDKSWYKPKYAIKPQSPDAEFEKLIPPFVEAAFRRPVTPDACAPFIALAKSELAGGSSFEQALRTAQIAVLCAPDFLYLVEPAGKLDDYALASRLSYMLWGEGPDAALLAHASKKSLAKPEVLRAETERLLADSRSHQFTKNFIGQWLNLREIDFTTPDKQLYPEYDETLKRAMVLETELFFEEVLKNNLSALSFIDSDWTFLNAPLARLYRVDNVNGMAMRKVALKPENRRGGVLTHASVLKVSANGTTTSPVVRGAYVLDRILGIRPPVPPPGIPGVEPDIRGATTLRQLLEKHRSQESCNGCHRLIDPPGFALESYDVMGGWRENYRSLGKDFPRPGKELTLGKNVQWKVGPPVDAAGETKDGKPFKDLADFKRIMLSQPKQLTRALVEKLATYGTGRGMGFSDRTELERLTNAVAAKNYGFRDMIHTVVQSEIFRSK